MKKIKSYIYNTVVIVLLVAGIVYVIVQFAHFGHIEYTDNARVCQHISPQNTRIQGFIREIRFDSYQHVSAGDTLVIIEDSEFRLRLAQAKSDLARAEQQSKATGSSIRTTTSSMSVTDASLEEAKINMENLKREDERYELLLAQDAVTRQQYDQIHTAYLSAKARYQQVMQTRNMQNSVVKEQEYHLSASEAMLEQAKAAVRLAELNLSYCYIIATHSGVVGSRDINVGQLVNPGQTFVSIVDETERWIEANYRESQLSHIHPGAEVRIKVDAIPDYEYHGVVERLSNATGSAFSLLPVDNATGNFVKVEQRVTVRIALDNNDPAVQRLKAGYSVECEVKY